MYTIDYQLRVNFVADGGGPVSVPSQQSIILGQLSMKGLTITTAPLQPTGTQPVPGADAPTAGNFATALTGSSSVPTGGMALDLYNAIVANLGQIQGFATGGL